MKKVLIVDDYAVLRKLIKKMIATIDGFEVVGEARDGIETLQMFREFKPDVVTLDLGLPLLDGMEVLKEIKETSPSTKVIIISSNDEALLDSKKYGADVYILKPFNYETIENTMKDLFEEVKS